jgi:2-polyprenyl-3-methyl-5-hydroxy-6-metoxy-1,4-benzoquinol methylase
MGEGSPDYAFPHRARDESRRLELLEQHLDPVTVRRVERLMAVDNARCLEIGAGRGSVAAWLARRFLPDGKVTATDLQVDLLSTLQSPNLTVRRHDVRVDDFPERSFDLVHLRAVLMHIDNRMATLRRIVSWLAPGGWLLVEELDFGMWQCDADPIWSAHPRAWHEAFPHGSMSTGRAVLRQIHQLGLEGVGADAELDIVTPGTPLAEFYRLSMAALADPSVAVGVLTRPEAAALVSRPTELDFLGCGFANIGAWGQRPNE